MSACAMKLEGAPYHKPPEKLKELKAMHRYSLILKQQLAQFKNQLEKQEIIPQLVVEILKITLENLKIQIKNVK